MTIYMVKSMRTLLILIIIWITSGCSSSSNHSKQVDYVKSKALFEYGQEGGTVPIESSKADFVRAFDGYPIWVTDPGEVYSHPVGVSCRPVVGDGYQGVLDAKSFAKEEARLHLFQKLNGDQKVSAREILTNKNGKKDVSLVIKRHSRGMLPANKVVNEVIVDNKNKKELCLAVSLLGQ